MSNLPDLPETYLRFYKNLTPSKLSLYHKLVSELEANATFMTYAHRWNKEWNDAYLDHMYYTVNYKMCLLRDVQRLEWLDNFSCGQKQVILDIGCGTGYFSYFAAKRGHTVYSMDAEAPIGKDIFLKARKPLGCPCTGIPFNPSYPCWNCRSPLPWPWPSVRIFTILPTKISGGSRNGASF